MGEKVTVIVMVSEGGQVPEGRTNEKPRTKAGTEDRPLAARAPRAGGSGGKTPGELTAQVSRRQVPIRKGTATIRSDQDIIGPSLPLFTATAVSSGAKRGEAHQSLVSGVRGCRAARGPEGNLDNQPSTQLARSSLLQLLGGGGVGGDVSASPSPNPPESPLPRPPLGRSTARAHTSHLEHQLRFL